MPERGPTRGPRPGPDVMGPAEVCYTLKISNQRLWQLRQQAGFPRARKLAIGEVFDGGEIRALHADRTDKVGRGRQRRRLTALQTYRATGNVEAAARAAGVTSTSIRRWFYDLGIPIAPTMHERRVVIDDTAEQTV